MISSWLTFLLAISLAYLLGSIPTGYWYARWRGINIQQVGSGNIGASNVQRIFGSISGVGVLLVDVTKGFVAAAFLSNLTPYPASDLVHVACGVAAIGGHNFSIFLKFKGGKGVATTCGVFLSLAPIATILVLVVFAILVALTRYISVGSLGAAALLPILVWLAGESGQYFTFLLLSLIVSGMIILRHRSNIRRILNGTENRLGDRIAISPDQGKDI